MLAQPLTGYTACPACGSTAFVKNGRDVQHLHDLLAQGKQVVIQVQRQRYLCRACRASCSQPLPDVDERRNMTRRLVEYIQRRSISTRRTFISIAEEVGLDSRSVRNSSPSTSINSMRPGALRRLAFWGSTSYTSWVPLAPFSPTWKPTRSSSCWTIDARQASPSIYANSGSQSVYAPL